MVAVATIPLGYSTTVVSFGRSGSPWISATYRSTLSGRVRIEQRFGALIRGDYRLLSEPLDDETDVISWELYNIREDPGETRDLAAQHADLVAELVQEWETNWRGPLIRRRL